MAATELGKVGGSLPNRDTLKGLEGSRACNPMVTPTGLEPVFSP